MTPNETEDRFLARLKAPLAKVGIEAGIKEMLAFYAEERVDDCDLACDGDMLLYQWGTHDWGDGKHFELDVTRQLITDEEEEPVQLSLTFLFHVTPELTALSSGNRWCHEPAELEEFRAFIFASKAFAVASKVAPLSVKVGLDDV